MREQGGGNGESRKLGVSDSSYPPFAQPCLVCCRRFLHSSRLGGVCGQGEALNYLCVYLMSDVLGRAP